MARRPAYLGGRARAYLGCGCARSLGPAVSPVVLFRLGPYAAFIVPPFGPPFLSPAPVPVAYGCSPGSRANLCGPLGASYVRCPRVSCSSPGPVRRPGRSRRGRRPAARAPAPSRPAPGPRAPSPALPGSSARRRFRGAFAASRARLRRAELVNPPQSASVASSRLASIARPWNRRPNRSRVYRSFTRSVKLFYGNQGGMTTHGHSPRRPFSAGIRPPRQGQAVPSGAVASGDP